MCLVLPSRIISIAGTEARIELPDGTQATVDTSLAPEVAVDDYVLVDRGLVLNRIDAEEARAILAMYAEFGDLVVEA